MAPPAEPFDLENWSIQVRRGLLELCILNMLARQEIYGYDLARQLAQIKGLGIPEGTVYPLLTRMRQAGLVQSRLEESANGPARKYYTLTGEGKHYCQVMNEYWNQLVESVGFLRGEREEDHGYNSKLEQ